MIGRLLIVGIRTGSALGRVWGIIRRRCSRQRKLANPVIRKGPLNVKKIFAYSVTITTATINTSRLLSRFFSFFTKTVFCYLPQKSPRATFCHFCLHFALPLLDKTLTPLKGWKKKKLVFRLSFPHNFLPASYPWCLHRQYNSKLAQVSLLADWFIVHLVIVVT